MHQDGREAWEQEANPCPWRALRTSQEGTALSQHVRPPSESAAGLPLPPPSSPTLCPNQRWELPGAPWGRATGPAQASAEQKGGLRLSLACRDRKCMSPHRNGGVCEPRVRATGGFPRNDASCNPMKPKQRSPSLHPGLQAARFQPQMLGGLPHPPPHHLTSTKGTGLPGAHRTPTMHTQPAAPLPCPDTEAAPFFCFEATLS